MSRFDKMQDIHLTVGVLMMKGQSHMTRTTLLITIAAAAALAGCNKQSHTITADQTGDNIAANAPVALPPSITASKSYRCKDNNLVYIDWLSDGTARVKKTRTEVGTVVTPGTDLKGDPKASTITYNGQTCDS
jgi:hypothetical protein